MCFNVLEKLSLIRKRNEKVVIWVPSELRMDSLPVTAKKTYFNAAVWFESLIRSNPWNTIDDVTFVAFETGLPIVNDYVLIDWHMP